MRSAARAMRAKTGTRARAAYERALALAPDEGAVLNNFGLSKLSAGDYDAAAALFVRALEASPDLAAAETNLRLALALGGRYDEALAGRRRRGRLPDALNNAGYAALLRGDYAQARILLLRRSTPARTSMSPPGRTCGS